MRDMLELCSYYYATIYEIFCQVILASLSQCKVPYYSYIKKKYYGFKIGEKF